MSKVVTFGEIMLRLSTPGFMRLGQAHALEVTYGGGEANVAVSLANYGAEVDLVTRLPANDLGDACLALLRGRGIGVGHVVRGGERIGIYFLETGAAQRASKVVYDRAGSSFAALQPGMVDWRTAFAGADWFHWTGITPAVSEGAARACLEAAQMARELGLRVSCDLNYRAKLWKWGRTAGEVMAELVEQCDVVIGNEEDAAQVFGIHATDVDIQTGQVSADKYGAVAAQLAARFPRLSTIAITLRGSLSASHNTWSGILWREGSRYTAPTHDILPIVDRVGAGDAFAGGLIYALRARSDDGQWALNFATAASCLKHSIPGDGNAVSLAEVEQLMGGDASGRVAR
jgi:2-dehydro-3-deoxygluconokinase